MSFPDLILVARNYRHRCDRLVLLAFESQSQRYIELESKRLLNSEDLTELQIFKVVRTPQSIIAATQPLQSADRDNSCYLIQLDLYLTEMNRIAFGSLTALATDGKNLFISAEGDFIILNFDLTILSRVELNIYGYKKNADDIFVHQQVAYVLDNVERPLFIFKFDCSDCHTIQLLEKQEFSASHPHLDAQWIDAATQRWYILVYNGNRFIWGQHLYMTQNSSPMISVPFQIIHENQVKTWNYIDAYSGNQILTSTRLVPPWIVVKEGEAGNRSIPKKLYLAKVMCDGSSVRVESWLDLYPLILKGDTDESPFWHEDFSNILIQEDKNRLFIVASRRNKLITKEEFVTQTSREELITEFINFDEAIILIVDTQNQPPILLNQRFEIDNQLIRTFALSAS